MKINEFSKEKVKANEVSLLDDASEQIVKENYCEALAYLQNCEQYIELCKKLASPYVRLAVIHNTAFCYFRLGRIEQAINYLDTSQACCESILNKQEKPTDRLKSLKYLTNLNLQLCAICSQLKQHEAALKSATISLKHIKSAFNVLSKLAHQYTAMENKLRLDPEFLVRISVVSNVFEQISCKDFSKKINIFGGEKWVGEFSIGNLMILKPLAHREMIGPVAVKQELSYGKVLENVCVLASGYFSVAAELRFIGGDGLVSNKWHDKALGICNCFLPKASPLFQHIAKSHKKHYQKVIKDFDKKQDKNRIYCKRLSEKPRKSSANVIRKASKKPKSNTPLRRVSSSTVRPDKKLQESTAKTSATSLHSGPQQPQKSRHKKSSGRLIMSQKLGQSIDSRSDGEISQECIFVLNSSDLYGDYSIKDEERDSTVIKKELYIDENGLKKFYRVDPKSRILTQSIERPTNPL